MSLASIFVIVAEPAVAFTEVSFTWLALGEQAKRPNKIRIIPVVRHIFFILIPPLLREVP